MKYEVEMEPNSSQQLTEPGTPTVLLLAIVALRLAGALRQ
jgi:hypothetical protein